MVIPFAITTMFMTTLALFPLTARPIPMPVVIPVPMPTLFDDNRNRSDDDRSGCPDVDTDIEGVRGAGETDPKTESRRSKCGVFHFVL
jgi:hypothetical protein